MSLRDLVVMNPGFVRSGRFCLAALMAVAFVAVFFAGPSAVGAEEPEFRWATGPWIGGYKFIGGNGDRAEIGPLGGAELQYLLNERFTLALRVGYGENGEWELGTYRTLVLNTDAVAQFSILPERSERPYAFLGFGLNSWRAEAGRKDLFDYVSGEKLEGIDGAIKFGLGVEVDLLERVFVDVRGSYGALIRENDELDLGGFDDPNTGEIEITAGLLFRFNGGYRKPVDTDRDGVPDNLDQCPNTPGCTRVDRQGCPTTTTADSDRDGVPNRRDDCPDTPYGAIVDKQGCPSDADGDGVFDGIDKCPDTPRGVRVDKTGCPKDTDRDGVFDGPDRCPDTPRRAVVDSRGCPLDGDGDGVFDGIDQCPNTPRGSRVDARGCVIPPPEPERVILEGVNFRTGTDELLPEAQAVLDEIARDLIEELTDLRLEIRGYTDAVGTEEINLDLSRRRAESVRNYLMARGVSAGRLTALGFGEADPVAPNSTPEGRAQNRRVEFRILQ